VVIRESESLRSEIKSCVRMVRAYAGLATVSLLEADLKRLDPVVSESICYTIGSILLLWLELSETLCYENDS
jgi:hypothetical protein